MKRIYSIILAVAMLAGTAVIADLFYLHTNGTDDTGAPDETVTIDGITYDLYYQTGNATVSKLTDTTLTSVTVPKTVESCTVTAIGESAFEVCTELTEIVLPDTITRIGNSAFSNCSSLTSIELPVATSIGNSAFIGCSALTSIELPVATSIGENAFLACSALTSIELPVATSIGNSAFFKCTSLTSVELPSATSIRMSTFSGCSALTSVELPVATDIGNSAFSYCSSLTSIELPVATSIGNSAFANCSALTLTALPPNLTTIEDRAFEGCTLVIEVTIPRSCTTIGANAFDAGITVNYDLTEGVALSWKVGAFGDGVPFATYTLSKALIVGDDVSQYLTPTYHAAPVFSLDGPASEGLTVGTDGILWGTLTNSGDLIIKTEGTSGDKTSIVNYHIPVDAAPFTYTYDETNKTARLVAVSSVVTGDITIPETVEYQGVTYKVTSFAEGLFKGRTDITGMTSGSVTAIPNSTFEGCTKLRFIDIPLATSVGGCAFIGCSALKTVNLLSSVESVGEYAFYHCISLTVISLPVTKTVGERAFEGCSTLTTARLPSAVTVGAYVFFRCPALTSIELPVATSIGESAFEECSTLTTARLPSAVTVGAFAFFKCTSLTSVELPVATDIRISAFVGCSALTSIELPVATSIGENAFANCSSLTSIELPVATSIGNSAFFKCTSLTSVELPSATSIRDSAFYECSALTSVELPVATDIGNSAFFGCINLASINLPSATSIGIRAFYECSALTSINLPSATSIRDSAFFKCTSLDYIHLNTNNVTFGQFIVSDDMTVSIIMSSLSTASGTWLDNTLPFTPFVIYSTESPIVLGYDMSRLVLTSYGSGSSTQTFKLEGEAAKGLTIGTDGKISGVISETGMLYIYETVGTVSLAWSVQIEQCVIDNVIYLPDLDKDTAVAIGCTDNAGDITIPYSVEYAGHTLTVVSIREMAFNEKNLVTVVIGTDNKSAITEIPNAAFQSCLQLVSITLPDSIVSFGPYAFVNCISLALTQLPSGVVSIGPSAFEGCTALALTELPSGLGFIDTYTFRECVNLKLTSLPDGITTVSEHAFQGCTSLALASLNNVATVGDHAFDGCTGLTATFDLSTVGSVGEGAFTNTSDITFKVPLTGIEIGENALGTGYYAWAEDIVVDKAVSISVQNKTANTSYSISGTGAGGLTVTEDGTISGTPQMVGTFTVTAKAKNTSVATFAVTGEKILPFVLSADTLYCITGKTVPASDDDIVTIDSAVPSGYTVTWAVTDGSGCGITVVDGVIKGTAGATGTYTITIVRTVTGHGITQEDTAELTVVIVDVLKITSTAKDIVPA